MRTLIKNARLLVSGQEVFRHMLIEDGFIRKITHTRCSAEKIIDAKKNFVLPGVIDISANMRDPGYSRHEDWQWGSSAAAAGGVTTILDLPDSRASAKQISKSAKKSIVNFGFHSHVDAKHIARSCRLPNRASISLFLRQHEGGLKKNQIPKVFEHAKLMSVYTDSSPHQLMFAEHLSNKFKNKLFFRQVSTRAELETLKEFADFSIDLRSKHASTFIEVCFPYLFLREEDMFDQDLIVVPKLPNWRDQQALWEAIKSDRVQVISSHHSPWLRESVMKPGLPGIEMMLPLLLDAVNKRTISIQQVVDLTAGNPALIFGIKDRGKIGVGYRADLTIVDMNLRKTVHADNLHSKCGWTPYEGRSVQGWPILTMVNGKVVFDGHDFYPGAGQEVEYIQGRFV